MSGDCKYQNYWASPPDANNQPEAYASADRRSKYLLTLLPRYVKPHESILELGCNVGRNLAHLWRAGYRNLTGVDINIRALDLSKELYPDMGAAMHHDTIEEFVTDCGTYDCIFTMAVLMHLPEGKVFQDIEKKVGRVLITIEDESTEGDIHFQRNYSEVFSNLTQIHSERVKVIPPGLIARVFTL